MHGVVFIVTAAGARTVEMRDASPRGEDEWPICLEATSHSLGNNNSADDTDTLSCLSNRITETERSFPDALSMHANLPYDQEGLEGHYAMRMLLVRIFFFGEERQRERERERERDPIAMQLIRETTSEIMEKTFPILRSTNSVSRSSENNDRCAIKTYFDACRDEEGTN